MSTIGKEEPEHGQEGQLTVKPRRSRREGPPLPLLVLGMLWALPLTLIGVLLAIPIVLARGELCLVRAATPALLVSGRFADFLLAHHPFGAMCAMAIGHVVIADRQSLTPQILTHELAHVRQAALWGIVFPFAYCAASLWAVLHGRDAYWGNTFEVAARRAERHA